MSVDHPEGEAHEMSANAASSSQDSKPPAKRSKLIASTTQQTRSRKKGRLSGLPSLPLDVLYEIFSHLLPLDVLRLSRTDKAFRRVLMHRSAISIWKASLINLDDELLPECPEDLNEVQYINLMFDKHCHNCNTPNVTNVSWKERVRFCSKCIKQGNVLLSEKQVHSKHSPPAKLSLQKYLFFEPWSSHKEPCCTAAAATSFMKGFDCVKGDKAKAKEFLAAITKRRTSVLKHARRCEEWVSDKLDSRARELEEIRYQRIEAIKKRLSSEGYADVIKDMPEFHDRWSYQSLTLLHEHPFAKETRPLTDRVWANIRGEMLEWAIAMKTWTQTKGRLEVLAWRRRIMMRALCEFKEKNSKLLSELMPGPHDVLEYTPVKEVMERPNGKGVTFEDFTCFNEPGFLEFIVEWRARQYETLACRDYLELPILHPIWDKLGNWEDDSEFHFTEWHKGEVSRVLPRATVTYTCTKVSCKWGIPEAVPYAPLPPNSVMWYPEFLMHHCCAMTYTEKEEFADNLCDYRRFKYEMTMNRQKWSCDHLQWDERASKAAERVVKLCDLDPNTTTAAEMDELDARFVCLKCSFGGECDGERLMTVRTWRNTVQHCLASHFGDRGCNFQRVSDASAAEAREKEAQPRGTDPTAPREGRWYKCLHCIDTSSEVDLLNLDEIKKHFERDCETENESGLPTEGTDYIRSLAVPPKQPLLPRDLCPTPYKA